MTEHAGKEHTVTGLVADRAGAAPGAIAIRHDGARGRRIVTYGALDEEARRLARGLAELGVGPGERVAFWLPNIPEWIALYLACARLGAVAVAVNTRFRSAEVADILHRSGARVLVLWPAFRHVDAIAILDGVDAAALEHIEAVVACDGGEGDGAPPALPAALAGRRIAGYADLAACPPHGDDRATPAAGCNIFTTSGTTSAPKFVLHDQRGIARHAVAVARDFGLVAPDASALQALPLCGVFGFCQATATLAAGAPMTLMTVFDAARAAALVRADEVTHMNATDGMFRDMLRSRAEDVPFPTLRLAGFAAFGTGAEDVVAEADARGLRLTGLYGMSEVQALFARQRPEAPAETRGRAGGWPVSAEASVRVRDPETGLLLGAGESGELEVRGPSRMVGYFGDEAATEAALTEDGFVRTGDLAHGLADGSFVFHARIGDALRLGGFLVNPAEIEDFVLSHPTVSGCQVVGVEMAGATRPLAFVTLRPGAELDRAALTAHCAAGMAKYKQPVAFGALDTFPVTDSPNGVKIQRARLREMAAGLAATLPAAARRRRKNKEI